MTNISSTYFGLHDKQWWRIFYNTFCLLYGISLLVILMGPNTDGPTAAWFRWARFLTPCFTTTDKKFHRRSYHGLLSYKPFLRRRTLLTGTLDSVTGFLALMLSGFAPIVHMFLFEVFEGIRYFPLLQIAYMELCYFVGTVFYLSHWPERRWPETFDIWVSVFLFLYCASSDGFCDDKRLDVLLNREQAIRSFISWSRSVGLCSS